MRIPSVCRDHGRSRWVHSSRIPNNCRPVGMGSMPESCGGMVSQTRLGHALAQWQATHSQDAARSEDFSRDSKRTTLDAEIQLKRSAFLVVSQGSETSGARAPEEVEVRRALVSRQGHSARCCTDIGQGNRCNVPAMVAWMIRAPWKRRELSWSEV